MPEDPIRLNKTDEEILVELEGNARKSVSKIAAALEISPGLVRRRMSHLEKEGVISKYTVVVDHWKIGRRIEAYVLIKIEVDADLDALLKKIVKKQKHVREAATLAGDEDAILRVRVSDPKEVRQTVIDIRKMPGVTETKTLVALDRVRHIPEPLDGSASPEDEPE